MLSSIQLVLILLSLRQFCQSSKYVEDVKKLLYPDELYNHKALNGSLRRLVVRPLDSEPNCPLCLNLQYCKILNGYMVEEVYISKQYYVGSEVDTKGTCVVIEALGKRSFGEIFGEGKPFRDDSQCKEMVMQYLCLFWGSDNYMYRNSCINKEDTSSPDPLEHKLSPRYPCRSFCTQIAQVCANSYDFLGVCEEIACPPTDSECTPDPILKGEVLSLGIGCDMPIFKDPYAGAAVAVSASKILATFLIVMSLWIFYVA